jgi:hypothetical protein
MVLGLLNLQSDSGVTVSQCAPSCALLCHQLNEPPPFHSFCSCASCGPLAGASLPSLPPSRPALLCLSTDPHGLCPWSRLIVKFSLVHSSQRLVFKHPSPWVISICFSICISHWTVKPWMNTDFSLFILGSPGQKRQKTCLHKDSVNDF